VKAVDEPPRTTGPTRRTPILALLGANAVSETGNVLAFVAIPWFVLQTTGSAAKTGLVGGAFLLAAVVASVVGGPVVDRLGFKQASIVADLAGAVTVALIPLLYHTTGLAFWQLLVLVFLGGFLDAPGHTARQSLVPDLAGRARMRIERANAAF
jgi:MFS family permease